ncbi:Transmembrane 9 superfamily member 4 [Triticum urartu]|uniref:Transmembrane 9 superfamily member n=1 Tax=Triticum urartu TaxID=4572 RepID=M7YW43_TRIUA|nr:Transmembrane 9 superfamily member 4 [Triticum urartu]
MAAMASPTTSTILSTLLLFLMHLNTSPATAFYLPGSYPHRYLPGEALAAKSSSAALFLCRTDPVSPAAADLIKSRIDDAYHVNLLLDTLPVVRYVNNPIAPEVLLRSTGFPVGVRADDGEYYVYNHLRLTVLVNKQKNGTTRVEALMATADASELISLSGGGGGGYTVVGFEVVPCSVEHDEAAIGDKKMYDGFSSKAAAGCDPSVVGMRVQVNRPLAFSYEVAFVESAVEWPSRWDAYLEMGGAQVHWFSILNSIVVVAFLAAIVLVILLRTVRRDLAQYEELGSEAAPHADDMAGWKLVAGDAFREPSHPVLLCVMVGDGVRILGMGMVTILFAALGFMSPASRGALVSGMLCLYLVLGLAAGYTSVRLWKTVRHGDSAGWKAVAWRASFVFPGVGFSVFTALNCVLWHNGSTGAVPFALFVVLILLWFFVSVPLTLAGGLLASRVRGHVEYPVKTNKIARQVPAAQCSPLSGPVSAALYVGYSLLMALAVMLATGAVGLAASFCFVYCLFSTVKLD